jgi:hypothetical protein
MSICGHHRFAQERKLFEASKFAFPLRELHIFYT